MDPDTRTKHTRSTEAPIGKSEKRSRARLRTVVRKTRSCETTNSCAKNEGPFSNNATWIQLLSTYSWSKNRKPVQTVPPRRLGLITRPLTERETQRETQWANAKESDTERPSLPVDIWVQILQFAICTACQDSWQGWYCGKCNKTVPRTDHVGSFDTDSTTTSRFFETRQQTKIRLRLERRQAELRMRERRSQILHYFPNVYTRRNVATVSLIWRCLLLLAQEKIDDLDKLISGTPEHTTKATLDILYKGEKYKCTPPSA